MTTSLSIVVTAYNMQNYIEQCVQSILDQLEPGHELIVLNDGSTDLTFERLSALQQGWGKGNFKLVNQANQGISRTRNNGLALATGEYLIFVDGDDLVTAGALAMLERAIGSSRPDAIAFDLRLWYPQNEQRSRRMGRGYPAGELLHDQTTILNILFADRKMYACGYVYKRAIYQQLPLPVFPPGKVFEDISTTPRLHRLCASLLYLPHELIKYRQHASSITKRITEQSTRDLVSALLPAKQFFAEHGVSCSVQRHFDFAVAYFYVAAVKDSYQLPGAAGARLRAELKTLFAQSLFGDVASVLASVNAMELRSNDPAGDRKIMRQVTSAINDSIFFGIKLTLTRSLTQWRRQRQRTVKGTTAPAASG